MRNLKKHDIATRIQFPLVIPEIVGNSIPFAPIKVEAQLELLLFDFLKSLIFYIENSLIEFMKFNDIFSSFSSRKHYTFWRAVIKSINIIWKGMSAFSGLTPWVTVSELSKI